MDNAFDVIDYSIIEIPVYHIADKEDRWKQIMNRESFVVIPHFLRSESILDNVQIKINKFPSGPANSRKFYLCNNAFSDLFITEVTIYIQWLCSTPVKLKNYYTRRMDSSCYEILKNGQYLESNSIYAILTFPQNHLQKNYDKACLGGIIRWVDEEGDILALYEPEYNSIACVYLSNDCQNVSVYTEMVKKVIQGENFYLQTIFEFFLLDETHSKT